MNDETLKQVGREGEEGKRANVSQRSMVSVVGSSSTHVCTLPVYMAVVQYEVIHPSCMYARIHACTHAHTHPPTASFILSCTPSSFSVD